MRLAGCLAAVVIGAAALGGCATDPLTEVQRIFQSKGEPQLAAGIKSYDDGRYKEASASFQAALNAGLRSADQVTAHKYLAFINCVSGREKQCRAHFHTALDIDSAFDLAPAEAGHPTWGPVFRNIKARR